jgi:hypothetical protein
LHKRRNPGFLTRLEFLHDHGFILMDIVELAYYDSVLWQVDLVFVRDDIVQSLERLKAFNGKDFRFDPSLWQR